MHSSHTGLAVLIRSAGLSSYSSHQLATARVQSRSASYRRSCRTDASVSRLHASMRVFVNEKISSKISCLQTAQILPIPRNSIIVRALTEAKGASMAATHAKQSNPENSFVFRHAVSVRLHRKKTTVGEDAFFASSDGTALGVADGVGGWILRGVDPGSYARTLMAKASEESNANANNRDPLEILQRAYDKVTEMKLPGSTTVCIVTIIGSILYSANLGDSGYMVVRNGTVVYKAGAQQHGFNFPFQLGTGDDIPTDAYVHKIQLQEGDFVILGSDGLFDNIFPAQIAEECVRDQGATEQQIADRLSQTAFVNSVSEDKSTPWGPAGGKEDDITVIVARVQVHVPSFFQ